MKKVKILLVNPSQKKVYENIASPAFLPLGLGYIGAYLKKSGHEVYILDYDTEHNNFINIIKQFKPNFIGFTVTTPTFPNAIELISKAREISDAKIVIGGIHATIRPEECMRYVDYVVVGEGEIAFKEIVENKIEEKIVKKDLIKNLDYLPFPLRKFSDKYTYPDALYKETYPIITSRGCTGQCTYCCTKQLYGYLFRMRSAKNIVDEIGYLIKNYNAKEIHIWDDNFILIHKNVFEIRDEILKRGIKIKISITGGVRVDSFDEKIAKALKDMGVYSIAFGVESGNQKVLDSVKKGITLEQVRKAVKIAKKMFEVWCFFMIGLPSETEESIRDTINFAKELEPDIVKFHIAVPYPESGMYKELDQKGFILSKDYERYGIHTKPVHKLEKLSPEQMIYWQKKAYEGFYLRPKILLKQILRLKSWNRVKLNIKAGLSVFKQMIIKN